jgi:tetratricopeptide (TPR) repeat protein
MPIQLQVSAATNRAEVFMEQGQYAEALELMRQAVKSFAMPGMRAVLGLALTYNNQYDEALEQVNEDLKLQPLRAETYWIRYKMYKLMNEDDNAEKDRLKALELGYRPFESP